MAEKQSTSRAQKAVSDVKKKSGSSAGTTKKNTASDSKKKVSAPPKEEPMIPLRVKLAVVTLGLFVLFLVMGTKPEGAFLEVIRAVLFGLMGKAAFYTAIPALLYLFIIVVSSKGQPIKMRSICLISFVLLVGSIYHLYVNNQTFVGGVSVLSDLYKGGISGFSGGLICGGVAMLLRWACGIVISYIILVTAAVLTVLAAIKITIPSLIRAFRDRPRENWDEDGYVEERPEPATIVVNHIANKHIEHKRQKRQKMLDASVAAVEEAADIQTPAPRQASDNRHKAKELMDQIADIEAPEEDTEEEILTAPIAEPVELPPSRKPMRQTVVREEELIPPVMPEFKPDDPILELEKPESAAQSAPAVSANAKVTSREAAESAQQVAQEIAKNQVQQKPVYCFPPMDLLKASSRNAADGTAEMRENTRRLNETLASFRIDAHIINATRGPSVTRYEAQLESGVRYNKVTAIADDIALSLGAPSVRIAPVPDKISVVGIEVPNRVVTNVNLREVIDSPEFSRSRSKSSFAVGKDIGGNCIVGNIAKMPHMLIAGTTGSGKSVCMNSIIISLLYKASPEDVKLIMVDPKMVELGIYNGIPHLLIPVVTDPKKAAGSLQWAVTEMMRRYAIMRDAGVRDMESYNEIVQCDGEGEKLPRVIIIIDELADLMLVAAKEVEDSICRIAQMGRAAGMHLIIATQRPSVDVITGLIKANMPSRIAFSVASAMESRIILDTQGAEKLVGKGDMLYAPIGTGKPQRVQGCFVSDPEVESVATYVKSHYVADYDQQVLDEIEKKAVQTGKKAATAAEPEPSADEMDGDELLPAAVDVILETGQASVSMLQRRLKLGYARAARIVDEMEEKGIVGPFQGSKPRTILVNKEQWEAMKSGGAGQMNFEDLSDDAEMDSVDE